MSICIPVRRRRISAVCASACLVAAPFAFAADDNDPINDTMAGAEALTIVVGERLTTSAALIEASGRLDVDFFMIDVLAGDAVTITLVRTDNDDEELANGSELNLRLHAYTPDADLISAPGVGENPAMTFTSDTDGPIYIGVGLARDIDLDGVDDADSADRNGALIEIETTTGPYDIEITIDRGAESPDVLFEDFADCDAEVNALCPPAQTLFPTDGTCLTGTLVKRDYPDCQPDTYLVLFDKLNNIVNEDDNNSTLGNGWASGLTGVNDDSGFIDNGNDTRSLRIGVTGRPDGLDGVFNGFFLNAPHDQFGEFTLTVTFVNADDGPVAEYTYTNRFDTGAEAFYINYDVPSTADFATINIDNTTGAIAALPDQDVFHLEGLIPFHDYYITQVGGLNSECRPTDTVMVWVDKNCAVIWDSNEYNEESGYEELTIIADYRGRANFAIAGEDQRSRLLWSGLDLDPDLNAPPRAVGDCVLPDPNIDDGCYTLCFRLAPPHPDASGPMTDDNVGGGDSGSAETAILEAMQRGDINMDGATDTADLGILLGNFGWTGD